MSEWWTSIWAKYRSGIRIGPDPRKGNKQRRCPLWARTVHELLTLVSGRELQDPVFRNRRTNR